MSSLTVFLVIFVVLAALSYLRWRQQSGQRRSALQVYAEQHGWTYREQDPALIDRFEGAPFGWGYHHQATNVVSGQLDGRAFVLFDYSYADSSTSSSLSVDRTGGPVGSSSSGGSYTVVAVNLGVVAPNLSVAPPSLPGRLWGALAGNDIEVGDMVFDHDYVVKGDSPEFARELLDADMVAWLREQPLQGWRIDRDSLLVITPRLSTLEETNARLDFARGLVAHVPAAVWARLKQQ